MFKVLRVPGKDAGKGNVMPKGKLTKEEKALFAAIRKGNIVEVERLLNEGVDLDVRYRDGWTPLHEACNQGHPDIVRLLLERGADVGARNRHGDTAHDIVVFFAEHEAEYKKLLLLFNT